MAQEKTEMRHTKLHKTRKHSSTVLIHGISRTFSTRSTFAMALSFPWLSYFENYFNTYVVEHEIWSIFQKYH